MTQGKILLVLNNPELGQLLERSALKPAGYDVLTVATKASTLEALKESKPDLIIIGDPLEDSYAIDLGSELIQSDPLTPVLLLANQHSDELLREALRAGFYDYLIPPLRPAEVLQSIQTAQKRRQTFEEWAQRESGQSAKSIQQQLNNLETLQAIGRQITSTLDLDQVLAAVVNAAVELTGAEEGSLLLYDESSADLYMRAERNIQAEFARTFRLPIHDSLAGQVMRTGEPVHINKSEPFKILTSYLVYALIFVPLVVHERVIGILGIANRKRGHNLSKEHITLLSALAGYAAVAIENARSYEQVEKERCKLETILTNTEEGIIVTDVEARLMLVNRAARQLFDLQNAKFTGKPIEEIIEHPDIIEMFGVDRRYQPFHTEISLGDGRVLNAQLTPIPDVGFVLVMQDITYLKELDQIKSDFVNTVSHDLRTPLTAILGYVELLDRVGPVNNQQAEFIRRIQISVNNITALINDLLDLGRIEAGFDSRKEVVPMYVMLRYAVDGVRTRALDKGQSLVLEADESLLPTIGNPIRLRQMLSNLIGNAIKYTQSEGEIRVRGHAEGGQMIIQVIDNGPGIPPSDQPYIFDKFYRGSNVVGDISGTGLGLAIVKSIVENHQGRIWVEFNARRRLNFHSRLTHCRERTIIQAEKSKIKRSIDGSALRLKSPPPGR